MSNNSSDTTVENPEEHGDTNLSEDVMSQSKEIPKNPSVRNQEGGNELFVHNKESAHEEKRQRTFTQKAIVNTMEAKNTEPRKIVKTLKAASDAFHATAGKKTSHKQTGTVLEPLQYAYTKYYEIIQDMRSLAKQDKSGEIITQIEETIETHKPLLTYASAAIKKSTSFAVSDTMSVSSRHTRYSRLSRASTSSSSARRRALADVAVARKQAEFEQLMAEKESERKQREAEEEFHREQKRAQHALHMALLESEKKKAVANAKLQAIEQSIREEETTSIIQQQFEPEDPTFRTQSWIDSQQSQHPPAGDQTPKPNPPTHQPTADPPQNTDPTDQDHVNVTGDNIQPYTPKGFSGNQPIFRPPPELPEVTVTSHCIESNALLEKLKETAKFNSRDKSKLQVFADVCCDVDNQMAHLSGLSCLNYPTAIKPVVDNLPSFLRFKWEKQVVKYAEENNDQYPSFHHFAKMIQRQARLKNHPNVVACEQSGHDDPPNGRRDRFRHNRVLKSSREVGKENDIGGNIGNEKYCLFHERKGHELIECKAFSEKTLEEKTEWVKKAGLCFRCLVGKHRAKQCEKDVKCDKCKSSRHPTILHKEREEKSKEDDGGNNDNLQSQCTSVCQSKPGGLSCSKILLVDVFLDNRPDVKHCVYAIMDDQSNASMITPNLADQLNIESPREKYLLTTCSGAKETKYGRRVSGISVRSISGTVVKLPNLIECEHIPQDKTEIPTSTVTKQHPHRI